MADKVKLSKDGSSIDFVTSESIPTSIKKLRQSPEIEGLYRFIFENDLQKEAFEILDRIVTGRKAKKQKDAKELKAAAALQKEAAKAITVTPAPKASAKATKPAPAPVKAAKAPAKEAKPAAKAKKAPAKPAAKAKSKSK